ncbi:hypothetical protein [Rhizobium straminoryzae]|uniref:hypothetical protein n=1 Tax=Rhizobium straminoryzae TaxID=1387186 RepID=UPI001FE97ADC|nr:hypothetical protein [Rhizobium straminoryzae]
MWDGEIWHPTFPNARYVFSAKEYGFFSSPDNHIDRHRTSFMARADSVDPVVKACQAVMIPVDGSDVFPGIRYLSTPGHSPFHASIAIDTEEGTALFAGDTMHHDAQVFRPEVNSIFDADADLARHSLEILLDTASTSGTIVFGAHLAGGSAIKITKTAKGYRWQDA